MYGVVLFAAMASAGPSCHCHSGPALCCPVSHGCCGEVRFFWVATPAVAMLSPEDTKLWDAYLAALGDGERADVVALWKQSDDAGRLKMLEQVRAMQPVSKDREPDRQVRTPAPSGRNVATNLP